MNKYAPPLQGLANNMAQHGRYGDSMLVHMNPVEVQGIASLSPTGQLTTNPVTGQPEAFLPMLAPLLGGALGSAALTGAGAGILGSGLSSAMAGAIGSGLASWAESGDMKEGLMSGLTGYGIGKAFGALGAGGKAAAEGTKQAALDPGLWTDATQGLIESGAAAAADPAAASLYQETTKGLGGMGERLSLMNSQRGQLIPNLMQQSPLIATGEMGRSQLQANKELEDSLSNLGEEDEDSLQRQYDILGGAWKQLQRDYNYPVQPYPRYANNGGFIKRYQEGGLLTGGPEQAAARQASIRGSVFVPPPETNAAGQPWRAGFDAEHNYFGRGASTTTPPASDQSIPPSNQLSPTINTSPLNFVTQGGESTGRYLGGTAPDLVSGIPGAGQGYVGDFGGAETIQNLDYSDYPKRSDFGSSDDGGHIEFKQAENEWFQDKTPSAFIDQPVMPLEATSPVVPMPPPPPIMDTSALPPQEIAPVPPPPPVMPTMPKRSDYGAEEGMDYRNDLNAYRSVDMQPIPPPIMPPQVTKPMLPPASPTSEAQRLQRQIDMLTTGVRGPNAEEQARADQLQAELDAMGQASPIMPPPMLPPQAVAPPPPQAMPPMLPPVMQPPPPVMQQPIPMPPIRRPVPMNAPPPPPPLPELGPRPKRSDYGSEDRYDYQYDLREWNEAKKARGYAEGGIIDLMPNDESMMAEQPIDPAMQQESQMADELIQQTVMAILGRVDDPDMIINMFIDQFGQEAFVSLREQVLNSVVPGAQTEGMIEGQGDGMSDEVMGMIGDQQQVATSPGEYIVPADVVSGIGNGSSDSGAAQLDGMINGVREERTGMMEQPEPIIPEEFMP